MHPPRAIGISFSRSDVLFGVLEAQDDSVGVSMGRPGRRGRSRATETPILHQGDRRSAQSHHGTNGAVLSAVESHAAIFDWLVDYRRNGKK